MVSEGAFTTHLISSQAAVYYYQNLGNQGQTILTLKDPVERGGEIEKQKYKAVETADYDFQGVDIGTMHMFSADDTYFEKCN